MNCENSAWSMPVGPAAIEISPSQKPRHLREQVRRGYAPQRGARAMTIAAGFRCSDGAVFAADSLITGFIKRHASKLWWFPAGDNAIAITGAGEIGLVRRIRHELQQLIKPSMTGRQILKIADGVVRRWIPDSKDPDDGCSLILAIRSDLGLEIFETQGGRVLSPMDSPSQCIGCGAALGSYLAETLFQPELGMTHARTIATYIIQQAKRHDEYCGGDTHILLIPDDAATMPSYVEPHEIDALEQELHRTRAALDIVLGRTGLEGVDHNATTAARRRSALETAVSAAQTHYISAEPGHFSLTGWPPNAKISDSQADQQSPQDSTHDPTRQRPLQE